MADKKNQPTVSQQYPVKADLYNDSQRSPQAVKFMGGMDTDYAHASLERQLDRNNVLPLPGKDPYIDKRKANQEMYNGGYTFRMGTGTGDKDRGQ